METNWEIEFNRLTNSAIQLNVKYKDLLERFENLQEAYRKLIEERGDDDLSIK